MTQWALLIGINQYRFFQPLSYAQRDAQALHISLIEADFSPEHCLLMTDTSPPMWERPTYPDRETILNWITVLTQQYLQSGDQLWCFFSGYGVCDQGRDYLVPIDGNPDDLATTALSVEDILDRLKASSVDAIVLLDGNRLQSSSTTEAMGAQTAQLADRLGISTVLSCQPGQVSHESAILGHGFFAAALLEGVRDRQTATLEELSRYLNDRLPELSHHYWRPIQQPLIISSPEKLRQQILPRIASAALAQSTSATPEQSWSEREFSSANSIPSATATTPVPPSSQQRLLQNVSVGLYPASSVRTTSTSNQATGGDRAKHLSYPAAQDQAGEPRIDRAATTHQTSQSSDARPPSPVTLDEELPDSRFWRSLLLWGGIAVAVLLLGVLLRNWASLTHTDPAPQPSISPNPAAPTANPPIPVAPPSNSTQFKDPGTPQATSSPIPTPSANQLSTNQPIAATAPQPSVNPSAPVDQPSIAAPNLASNSLAAKGLPAPSLLDAARAKTMVKSQQASAFWNAIQEANKIQPTDPQYPQAQREIAGWSREIWAIAQERSNQGFYDLAILAARLIPSNQPNYNEAQAAIRRWCPSFNLQPPGNPVQQQKVKSICK